MSNNIDDYIDRGLKGDPEIKPAERREFLSQLRERIILALSSGQVMNKMPYKPLSDLMKKHPSSRLFLDGDLNYNHLSKYIRMASENGIPFTIVDDKSATTNIGLVLSAQTALDKEEIFVAKEEFERHL
ncbi:YueI family protein [Sutcliffiella rhizosphaerae]|uniref:DUF1694 domain-containing protein n=1 Tax=Sutcliffiella rhizosphaerae TaxID=2880967 RepID=A0ABM8YJ62_9BACI|nr:YueI family protein [Sutcliffiella rhizosphaerae]CAG9619907.1 putative protein YueI [Sutcliffiella rhizosphaerae]